MKSGESKERQGSFRARIQWEKVLRSAVILFHLD
jgi:hypothetical protein